MPNSAGAPLANAAEFSCAERARLKKRELNGVIEGVQGEARAEPVTIASLGVLYEHRYRKFLRVAEAIVGEFELAHDVVQEAFARVIRSRFEFRGHGDLEGWVWRTVVNTPVTRAATGGQGICRFTSSPTSRPRGTGIARAASCGR